MEVFSLFIENLYKLFIVNELFKLKNTLLDFQKYKKIHTNTKNGKTFTNYQMKRQDGG